MIENFYPIARISLQEYPYCNGLILYLVYDLCRLKRGSNKSANNIDPCQPARTAQADLDRNFC